MNFSPLKTFFAILAGIIILSQAACLTIEEDYTFKPNGSGTMKYMVDMSEMASLLEMAKEQGENPMDEDLNMGDIATKLEGIPGLSKIESIEEKEKYIFGVTFKFANIKALNDAMNAMMVNQEDGGTYHTFFTKEGKTFTRNHMLSSELNPADLLGEDGDSDESKMMLEAMKYKLKFNFKKPVKAVYTTGDAKFKDSKGKIVEMEANFSQIIEDTEVLSTTITTK